MSEKNGSPAIAPKSINTLVGAGMRIDGDIACTGILRVQGEIVGNVSNSDKGDVSLMVDGAGSVTGAVSAAHVSVRGRIAGPVQSRETIEVHQGGSIVGDISFNRIAIHAGGIVDGMFSPLVVKEVPLEAQADKPAAAFQENPNRPGGTRKLVFAAVAIAAVSAGVWTARHPEIFSRTDGNEAALKTAAGLNPPLASQPATAVAAASPPPREAAPADAAPEAPASNPASAQEAAPPTAETEKPTEKIVSVKGINPSRPAGVFLLISNEPSVLYRKKRDEAGEGAKIPVPAGEKASVAIAPDELIRVSQGRDVVILFQGAKVPRNIIDSGAWISFVPK